MGAKTTGEGEQLIVPQHEHNAAATRITRPLFRILAKFPAILLLSRNLSTYEASDKRRLHFYPAHGNSKDSQSNVLHKKPPFEKFDNTRLGPVIGARLLSSVEWSVIG